MRRRSEIMALLEERPYSTTELAELLGVQSGLGQCCQALARRGAIVKSHDRWMLPASATTVEPPRPTGMRQCEACPNTFKPRGPQKLCAVCKEKRLGYVTRAPLTREDRKRILAEAMVDRLLAIDEPSLGTAVCPCGKRFMPLSDRDTRCSPTCDGPTVPATRTLVIGGQTFEAVSVGSRSVTGDYPSGSALLGVHRITS